MGNSCSSPQSNTAVARSEPTPAAAPGTTNLAGGSRMAKMAEFQKADYDYDQRQDEPTEPSKPDSNKASSPKPEATAAATARSEPTPAAAPGTTNLVQGSRMAKMAEFQKTDYDYDQRKDEPNEPSKPDSPKPEATAAATAGSTTFLRGGRLQQLNDFQKTDYDYDNRPEEPTNDTKEEAGKPDGPPPQPETKITEQNTSSNPEAVPIPEPTTTEHISSSTAAPPIPEPPPPPAPPADHLKFEDAFKGQDFAYIFLLVCSDEYLQVADLAKMCNLETDDLLSRLNVLVAAELLKNVKDDGDHYYVDYDDEEASTKKEKSKEPEDKMKCVMLPDSVYEKLMESAPGKFNLSKDSTPCEIRFRILTIVARHLVPGDYDDINITLRFLHRLVEFKLTSIVTSIFWEFEDDFLKKFDDAKIIELQDQDPSKWPFSDTLMTVVCDHSPTNEFLSAVFKFWPAAAQIPDCNSSLPLHLVANYDWMPMVEVLYNQYPDAVKKTNDNGNLPFHNAVQIEDLKTAKFLAPKYPMATVRTNTYGNTPLHVASDGGYLENVKFIYELNPEVIQWVNDEGDSPLHLAAYYEEMLDVVKFLTEKWPGGVKLESKDGYLPLHYAAECSDLEVAKFLYEQWPEAAKKIDKVYGLTPFATACDNGRGKIALFLAEKCPEVCTTPDFEEYTPLHLLTNNYEPPVALTRFLIEKYPELIGMKTGMNDTALHLMIVETRDEDPETEMLRARGELEDPDEASNFAAQKMSIIKEMVEKCPDALNVVNDEGLCPTYAAYKCDYKTVFRYLGEKFPETLKIPDSDGNTILHDIASAGEDAWTWAHFVTDKCPETVTVRNNDGKTPLEVAEKAGFDKFKERLSKKILQGAPQIDTSNLRQA